MSIHRCSQGRARQGFTLIEVVLVSTILLVLARTLVETSSSMSKVTSTGSVQALLQEQGERALDSILKDLRRSGAVLIDGRHLPYVFDDGVAEMPFEDHLHQVCDQEASEGDSDHGVMREVVIVLPSDLDGNKIPDLDMDGNGWPEFDGDGNGRMSESAADYEGIEWDPAKYTINPATGVVWSHQEISFVTVTHPDGINYLERRLGAGEFGSRRVARDIELVQFDTWKSSGYSIPMNSVRVRVFLRRRTDEGTLFRHRVEAVVRLRNTEEAG